MNKYGFDVIYIQLFGVPIPLPINYYLGIWLYLSIYIANVLLFIHALLYPNSIKPDALHFITIIVYLPFIIFVFLVMLFIVFVGDIQQKKEKKELK